ncbi:MAG: hypothetical protein IJV89_08340 [Lentisphaeria bacterium]|nr:hypothetical protein [Lentisphaeria bacterium]
MAKNLPEKQKNAKKLKKREKNTCLLPIFLLYLLPVTGICLFFLTGSKTKCLQQGEKK